MAVFYYAGNKRVYDSTSAIIVAGADGKFYRAFQGQSFDIDGSVKAELDRNYYLVAGTGTGPAPEYTEGGPYVPSPPVSYGTAIGWFDTEDDLPTATFTDQMAGTRDDNSLWRWDGTIWKKIVGGGGTIPAGGTPQNLFIQQTQPDVLIDSVWIPVDGSGIPADPTDWEFYTGTGDGNGGNLIVGGSVPASPGIDTLWVKTTVGGTVSSFYDWQIYSGHGSVDGVGNPNLFFAVSQPSVAPAGSLWIPLNSGSLTPRAPDTWRVFT